MIVAEPVGVAKVAAEHGRDRVAAEIGLVAVVEQPVQARRCGLSSAAAAAAAAAAPARGRRRGLRRGAGGESRASGERAAILAVILEVLVRASCIALYDATDDRGKRRSVGRQRRSAIQGRSRYHLVMIYLTPAVTGMPWWSEKRLGSPYRVEIVPGEQVAGARRDLDPGLRERRSGRRPRAR